MRRFLRMMKDKLTEKRKMYPHRINLEGFSEIHSFKQFDDRYTAPFFGFSNAEDYWEKCSNVQFLPVITVPTLMISAADDPFLTPGCFPYAIADQHRYLHFEATRNGGHVGFMRFNINGIYWHEKRAIAFIREHIGM